MNVTVKQGKIEREPAEVLVLTHFEGVARLNDAAASVDRALSGQLRNLLKSGEFEGKLNQTVLLHASGRTPAKRILLVGLGKKKDARVDCVRQALGTAVKRVRQAGASSFVTCLHGEDLPKASVVELAQALVEGAILGTYQFTEYLSDKKADNKQVSRLTVLATDARQLADLKDAIESCEDGSGDRAELARLAGEAKSAARRPQDDRRRNRWSPWQRRSARPGLGSRRAERHGDENQQ